MREDRETHPGRAACADRAAGIFVARLRYPP